MRIKQNRLKVYHHRAAVPKKDNEGNSYTDYEEPVSFKAEQWAAGGKIQAELYGIRISNIRNLRIEGEYQELSEGKKTSYQFLDGLAITVNDGICLNVSADADPDYRVIAIHPHRYLTLEVERI